MVRIRLRRMGTKKKPFYRIVVADQRCSRDGRFIESIGYYDPTLDPPIMKLDKDRAQYWLDNGAQPSDTTRGILKIQGLLGGVTPRKAVPKKKAAKAAKAAAAEEVKPEEPKVEEVKAPEPKPEEPEAEEVKAEKPKPEKAEVKEEKPAEPKAKKPEVEEEKAEKPRARKAKPEEPAAGEKAK